MILIALGANLPGKHGSPEHAIEKAIEAIERRAIKVVARSQIWLTEPVPVSDQPLYRNAVIGVETSLSAHDLLSFLHEIEAEFGRVRHLRNEARVLDLDLLAYDAQSNWTRSEGGSMDAAAAASIHMGGNAQVEPALVLPHPRMHERAFVLVPLCEICPNWVHPVLKKTATALLDDLCDPELISTMKVAA